MSIGRINVHFEYRRVREYGNRRPKPSKLHPDKRTGDEQSEVNRLLAPRLLRTSHPDFIPSQPALRKVLGAKAQMARMHSDPDLIARRIAGIRASRQRPEVIERISQGMRAHYARKRAGLPPKPVKPPKAPKAPKPPKSAHLLPEYRDTYRLARQKGFSKAEALQIARDHYERRGAA